jgi:hypothetical protein
LTLCSCTLLSDSVVNLNYIASEESRRNCTGTDLGYYLDICLNWLRKHEFSYLVWRVTRSRFEPDISLI